MAVGRWLDDAYGGAERPRNVIPTPRLRRYLRWTSPAAVLTAVLLTVVAGSAGWAVALALWVVVAYVPYRLDEKQELARRKAGPTRRSTPH